MKGTTSEVARFEDETLLENGFVRKDKNWDDYIVSFTKKTLYASRVVNSATISLVVDKYPVNILVHVPHTILEHCKDGFIEEIDDRFIENGLGQMWELLKNGRNEFLSLQESYEKGKPENMGILKVPKDLKMTVDFVSGNQGAIIRPTFNFNFEQGNIHFFDKSSYMSAEEFFGKSFNLIEETFHDAVSSADFSQK